MYQTLLGSTTTAIVGSRLIPINRQPGATLCRMEQGALQQETSVVSATAGSIESYHPCTDDIEVRWCSNGVKSR